MNASRSINIARLLYLLACEAAAVGIAMSTKGGEFEVPLPLAVTAALVVAFTFIGIEKLLRGFTLRGFSTATLGLGVGLLCAWLLTRVQVNELLEVAFRDRIRPDALTALRLGADVALYASLGFLGAALALRGDRDDFALVIPYVRFRGESAGSDPLVTDLDTLADARLPGLLRSGFVKGRLVVPRFVFDELQTMSESTDAVRRQAGRAGLEALEKLRGPGEASVSIHDMRDIPQATASAAARIVETAQILGARVLTGDPDLAKLARLRNVEVLDLRDLESVLRPEIAIGQRLRLALVRSGKEDHQAVGYLHDGTMIVVNHAVAKLGTTADVVVISTLQTAGGLLVFAELVAS